MSTITGRAHPLTSPPEAEYEGRNSEQCCDAAKEDVAYIPGAPIGLAGYLAGDLSGVWDG